MRSDFEIVLSDRNEETLASTSLVATGSWGVDDVLFVVGIAVLGEGPDSGWSRFSG